MHQGHAIQYILALSSWPNNVYRYQSPYSICTYRFVSRSHNISGFEDCGGIASNFELEDLFRLVIQSSCCDEPFKQQLWVHLYCFIVDSDSTFCCTIDVKIFSPTSFAVSTFTLLPAFIPVTILRKLQLSLNRFRDSRNSNSSHESAIMFPLPCRGQVFVLLTYVMVYTSTLLRCIIYLSANRVLHQPDEALGKLPLQRFHQKVAISSRFSTRFVQPENLPLTSSADRYHTTRVYLQVQVWE